MSEQVKKALKKESLISGVAKRKAKDLDTSKYSDFATFLTESKKVEEKLGPIPNRNKDLRVQLTKESYRQIEKDLLQESKKLTKESTTLSNVDVFTPAVGGKIVRRVVPNLLHFDLTGVQPLKTPTGEIFAMTTHYSDAAGGEVFGPNGPRAGYSGSGFDAAGVQQGSNIQAGQDSMPNPGPDANSDTVDDNFVIGTGGDPLFMEGLGVAGNNLIGEIEAKVTSVSVKAMTRKLKASISLEAAQDLKAYHSLDAEKEISSLLSATILHEMNQEVLRTCQLIAKLGAQDTTTAGIFDLSVDAAGTKVAAIQELWMQIQTEANEIAKRTRRGKGNFIVASSNVMAKLWSVREGNLFNISLATPQNDALGSYVGEVNGFKCYIDPYAQTDYILVGFKGSDSEMEAGLFYCPYRILEMYQAIDPATMRPNMMVSSRYGWAQNPLNGVANYDTPRSCDYFRIFRVDNI